MAEQRRGSAGRGKRRRGRPGVDACVCVAVAGRPVMVDRVCRVPDLRHMANDRICRVPDLRHTANVVSAVCQVSAHGKAVCQVLGTQQTIFQNFEDSFRLFH